MRRWILARAAAAPSAARWPVGSGARLAHALLLVALLAMTRALGFLLLARVTGRVDLEVIDGWTFAALLAASALSLGGVIGLGLLVWGEDFPRRARVARGPARSRPPPGCGRWDGLLRNRPAGVDVTGSDGRGGAAGVVDGPPPGASPRGADRHRGCAHRGDVVPRGPPADAPADPRTGGGLLLTAVLFALYHLRFELWGLLGKTAFGLVFGLLRDRTGRLVSPAMAHGITWTVLGFH